MNVRGTFVIRKHVAERAGLHFDLHLDGESFAVRKGVPTTSGVKVLAIKTQYHSPSEARFTGTIPKGQYGAGTTEVIDEGEITLIEQTPNKLSFQLRGDTYRGNYVLIKTPRYGDKAWLLWKKGGQNSH